MDERQRRQPNQGEALPPLARRLEPWRCVGCGTLQMELWLGPGSVVRVKCRKCNTVMVRVALAVLVINVVQALIWAATARVGLPGS